MARNDYQKTPKGKWNVYIQNSRVRGIPFDITYEDFVKLILSRCYYCGCDGYGIDRIDNSVGYTIENCFPCCIICNKMKSNLTVKEFLDKCNSISNNLK